jgi:hypothetical protein
MEEGGRMEKGDGGERVAGQIKGSSGGVNHMHEKNLRREGSWRMACCFSCLPPLPR